MGKGAVSLTCLFFLLCSCISDKDATPPIESWSEALVQNRLEYRYTQGDTLARDPKTLLQCLPELNGSFVRKEEKSKKIFEGSYNWTEAQCAYFQSDGAFVDVYVADYSADKEAYLRLIRRYMEATEVESSLSRKWMDPKRGVFAWEWIDMRSHLHYLEAGAYSRFHLLIRTDLPEARSGIASIWNNLDWETLKNL